MSKIAELLKLAEKKKEENIAIEDPPLPLPFPKNFDAVSRGKQEQVSIIKREQEQVSGNRNHQEQIVASKNTKTIDSIVKPVEISPVRDYTKVSNSITKRAIPEKYFRGLSKHTYDVLYQRTRGAINPTRTIQLTKDELVRLTGISKDAIKLHIKYLKEKGLLDSRPAIGSHSGWEYEIFVPEEIEEAEQVGVRQGKVRQGKASENLPLHSGQNLPLLTPTNRIENKDSYEFPKTSFKDNTKNDDDARVSETFSVMAERFDAAVKKLTGKGVSKNEAEKWGTLADLLILELEIVAKRTDSISSVPAFLTEVLRRQFFASRQEQSSTKSPNRKIDTVGKSDSDTFKIKPLDAKGREAALEQLREFAADDFLQDFKKWYLPEDWSWLMTELEKLMEKD
jgi:hypothetical protein